MNKKIILTKKQKELQRKLEDFWCRGGHIWIAVKNPKAKPFSFFDDGCGETSSEPELIKQCWNCMKYD